VRVFFGRHQALEQKGPPDRRHGLRQRLALQVRRQGEPAIGRGIVGRHGVSPVKKIDVEPVGRGYRPVMLAVW